ncbi:MAG: magnesium-translocating P-type ATPase [Bacteroidetes bacterium]|nr:magnesium-translocating P-type ATPase [Bacteroidota bacterium]MBS1670174.1 magnesium-translocating P-type ATPase [Bacteroidota bacterium]
MTTNFWQFDTNYWFTKLNSSINGLNENEAAERLYASKQNKKHYSALQKDFYLFFRQFKNPLVLLLIGAVILSAFLGDHSDVFIILFIVLSSGILSFFQERNAGRVVEKLQSLIALKATVLRNGIIKEIIATEVVTGDIILLKAGDMLPADCLIIESNELHANEASLTGESYPARKEVGIINTDTELSKRTNCLWQGSNIVSGTAKAIAINTGKQTIFGSIVQSASSRSETTFEKGIKDFGFFLMRITLVLSFCILIVNLLNHKNVVESALFALALAVGMAPELLPAITTIAMSAGAKRMLAKKVIVKKLSSIQNIGEINLLCTDKTGTITEGNISVHSIIDANGNPFTFAQKLAYWNAFFQTGYNNPIDEALKKINIPSENIPEKIGEVPYDFIRKRLSIAINTRNEKLLISKGAFNEIISICNTAQLNNGNSLPITPLLPTINKLYESFGEKGFRVIAICYKTIQHTDIIINDEAEMIFAGFILLQDPIKEDIVNTIEKLHKLKVQLKIITGDNRNVAKCIGLSLGIKKPIILTGKDLLKISAEALPQKVKRVHIFAEVEPQQKERIIRALRKTYTVAYMGDGINDVSAINAADIGISVDNAVDVAREAADFVLLEKKLSVLIDGIKEGRKTFSNTLKYILINTGSTFGNMFSVSIASLILPFLPMLPKQILLTNFITDFPYLSIASDNVDAEQLNKPGKWNLKMVSRYMIIFGIHSSLFDVITFLVLLYGLKLKEASFQTGWFIESCLTQLFVLFILRTRRNFFKSKASKYLFWLSLIGIIITIMLPYFNFAKQAGLYAMSIKELGLLLFIVAGYIFTADILKVWFFKKYKNN